MNLIISLLYAPLIVYLLKNFDIKNISVFIFIFSFIWLFLVLKKGLKEFIFPLIYLIISIIAYSINDLLILKFVPSLISLLISTFIFYSYISKNSFIFIFLDKFNKQVEKEEKDYINKSTLFWFIFSIINLLIHIYILYINNLNYWMIYSSLGWYLVFIIAGILQFIHKKFYFEKRNNV